METHDFGPAVSNKIWDTTNPIVFMQIWEILEFATSSQNAIFKNFEQLLMIIKDGTIKGC